MFRRSREHRLLRVAARQDAVAALQGVPHRERQVDLAPLEHREQVRAHRGGEGDGHVGEARAVFAQHVQQQGMQDGFHDADAQRTMQRLLHRVAQVFDLLRQLQHLLRVGDQGAAGGGQHVFLADPFEQRRADLLFQLVDLRRDRRRRVSQILRGFREAAQLRDPQKTLQISQFHNSSSIVQYYRTVSSKLSSIQKNDSVLWLY